MHPTDTSAHKIAIAGLEYAKPQSYQKLWGRNWRTAWVTPVRVPFLWLDKVDGGLTPSKNNGGNETKGLKLTSPTGKEYALRSVNKSRNDVVPKEFKGTFVEDIIQDGVSMSHPYGALALPLMEDSAGIYHAEPQLVYLPKQPALDSLNDKYGDDLYMIEQRMSGDWSDANNLGNFQKFFGTMEVVEKLQEDNRNKADQFAFVKARLFDMFLGDWDRHEDQWKWGERKSGDQSIFIGVPRDRDQVFFKHDGFLIDRTIPAIGNGYMQNFDFDNKDISKMRYEARNIDQFFTNEMTLSDWIHAAKSLQQSLSDHVIEQSIRQLPPEVFAATGREIIEKLKSRRNHLVDYATRHYGVLAKDVEIAGSKKREYFEVTTSATGELVVRIYGMNAEGNIDEQPFYARNFNPAETKTIRLFGIDGRDTYSIDDNNNAIKLRIIGGKSRDSVIQKSPGSRIHIYDNRKNAFHTQNARYHISSDSSIHAFDYFGHEINKRGFVPTVFYNDYDRVYIGLSYHFTNYKWRRQPFASKQSIDVHYSITQKAFSTTYSADIRNVIGKWNLSLLANYDAVRWANFFGLGNETVLPPNYDRNFNRIRSRDWSAKAGLNRQFRKNTISILGFYQSVNILADSDRYVAKVFLSENSRSFQTNNYAGVQLAYTYYGLNDSIVPTRGITLQAGANYFYNTAKQDFFQRYMGRIQAFLPLGDKFSIAIRAAGATTLCKTSSLISPEFYEHAIIGGPSTLRGFIRERFWGKSAFYNTNELRYITTIRTHFLYAKAGLLVFFDDGRVWMPNENSNTLHTSYGAGILFAPFRKISATVTYGISNESRLVQASVFKIFR